MKFGRNLPRNQVPEWASQYINYKALKKLIKNAQIESGQIDKPDLAGFFHALDRNLEDVDYFYSKKYQDLARRLKLLEDRYGSTKENTEQVEKEERDDLLQALLELRGQFRKLQWYGEVNRKGFVKITKKLDKKVEGSYAQKKYLALKVDPCSFATNDELFKSMEKINSWISRLSEAAQADQLAGQSIPHQLHRSSSKQALRIPDTSWVQLEKYIKENDAEGTAKILDETRRQLPDITERQFQQFLKELLQRSIVSRSRKCVTLLLEQIVYLDDSEDINKRNCIHRLVLSIGRAHANADESAKDERTDVEKSLYSFITPAAPPTQIMNHTVPKDDQHSNNLTRGDASIEFFQFLLRNLNTDQRNALASRDSAGRTPLHFAAEFGIPVLVQIIIEHLKSWGMFNFKNGFEDEFWQDNDGWTPLHLSVIQGHPVTSQALLEAEASVTESSEDFAIRQRSSKTAAVLAIATKANFIEIVRILVKAGVDLNCQDSQGETALHVAARYGHVECAQILLEGGGVQKINTEIREHLYGWTPLFIASVDGRLPIVELLIESGAKLDGLDDSGWSAHEHAALRGHIELALRLSEMIPAPVPPTTSSPLSTSTSPPRNHAGLIERRSNGIGNNTKDKNVDTIKQFGHRYLKDKSMILVSLGAMDMRKTEQAVSLDYIPMTSASSTQLDTALSVVVSAKGADGEPEIIDLPVHDNISTDPVVFHAVDPSKVQLRFDLVPTYAGNHEKIVGRGVALLSSIKANLGSKRMPLQGDISVPIMTGDFEVIGSITFNFLVITPFLHPKMSVSQDQTYWRKVASTMVIGHRGLGKNFAAGRRSLQLGENTLQSFIAAANLGASYVEFDVQLTKDHVPVIYHDFLVSETGIDAPVHTLTLEQFLHVNESMTPRQSRTASPMRHPNSTISTIKAGERASRGRSMSVGGTHDMSEMEERMKHTRDFKKKGFKGNSRGNHIQAPFATLEELFKKLPNHVGFNIEMKYPMLSESQEEDMDWYAVELNSFVDTVLTKVYDLGQGRNIIFSSFNPDICLLLSFKQPNIPVMFLTDAGSSAVGDIRASSLQEAIRFAARWNLLGIVSASQPFVIAPRLVRVVKESGLVCVSYGVQNNEDEYVDLQVQQGIDAVIVDNVLKIRKGLSEASSRAERKLEPGLNEEPAELKENQIPVIDTEASTTSSVATLSLSGDDGSEQSSTEPAGKELPRQIVPGKTIAA